jgi:hypothetical protein
VSGALPFTVSEDHDLVMPAFIAVLAKLSSVEATRVASVKSDKGNYSYTYANIGDVLDVVRPAMEAEGLAVSQPVASDGNRVAVSTWIIHGSGQWIVFDPLHMPAGGSPQAAGSAITYGRRYALLSALGMVTEDDDGGKAEAAVQAARTPPARPSTPPARSGQQDRPASPPAARPPQSAPTAPLEARTPEERAIRRALFGTSQAISDNVKDEFARHFGCPLADLPVERHVEALEWVRDAIERAEFAAG